MTPVSCTACPGSHRVFSECPFERGDLVGGEPHHIRTILIFSQSHQARLRFPNRGLIANINRLCDDAYRVPDGAGFCSGPGHRINWPVCLEEVSMAVLRQHRVNDSIIRSRIAKMNISPINHSSKFIRVVSNEDLTPVQIAMNKRVAGWLFDRGQAVEQGCQTTFDSAEYHVFW